MEWPGRLQCYNRGLYAFVTLLPAILAGAAPMLRAATGKDAVRCLERGFGLHVQPVADANEDGAERKNLIKASF